MSRTRSSWHLGIVSHHQRAASGLEHRFHHPNAKPGQPLPVLNDDGMDRRITQQFPQLRPAVVQPAGNFRHYLVQQDAVLSGVGPQAIGLVLQMRLLLGAAHPGIANDTASWSLGIGQDVDDVADLLGLEFRRESSGVVMVPCRHAVHAMPCCPLR